MATGPKGDYVYVACWFSNLLMKIDTTSLKVVAEVKTGDGPRAFGRFILK
ncbi:MAG: hypothetical protein JJ964_16415 [Rhizobiales bacterium]|nr:hypothetical protein [Hyphomicrobiales bacterium]